MAFYTVHEGDTLGGIAQAFDTTVDALMGANPSIQDPDEIFAGQTSGCRLRILEDPLVVGEIRPTFRRSE
jgi:nucleoid-associated protein YgaU